MCVPFFCRGSNVYLKLTEEYCSCVVKTLNTHVEIMKVYRYIICLFIYIYTDIYIYIYVLCCYILCMMCQWKWKIKVNKKNLKALYLSFF